MHEVARASGAAGCRYHITGWAPSSVWGEPRGTLDVDVVVELRPERVGDFCAALGGELLVDLDAAMAAVVRGSMFRINLREWGLKVNVIVSPPEGDAAHRFGRAVRTRLQPG